MIHFYFHIAHNVTYLEYVYRLLFVVSANYRFYDNSRTRENGSIIENHEQPVWMGFRGFRGLRGGLLPLTMSRAAQALTWM